MPNEENSQINNFCLLYGIEIHELFKFKIDSKNSNENDDLLKEYFNMLCYRIPDSAIYFYYNFPEYQRLYLG